MRTIPVLLWISAVATFCWHSTTFAASFRKLPTKTRAEKVAKRLPRQPCSATNPISCHEEGMTAFNAGDFATARARFATSCATEDPLGCFKLGLVALREKKLEEARGLFSSGCEQQVRPACHNLANTLVLLNSTEEARRLYKFNCKAGDSDSCFGLQLISQSTQIAQVPANPVMKEKKAESPETLCKNGDVKVCLALGFEQDEEGQHDRSNKFYEIACNYNDATGCLNDATYRDEKGESKAAIELYNKACSLGEQSACIAIGSNLFRQGKVADAKAFLENLCQTKQMDAVCAYLQTKSPKGISTESDFCSEQDPSNCDPLVKSTVTTKE